MTGDDEEGVVDADAQPDEHAEHRGEVGDGHDVAEQHDAGVGGADAGERGGDGQQRGGERAEGEEQHDGGHQHADDLGEVAAGGLGAGDGGAAEFDLEAGGLGGLGGVHHGVRLGGGDVLGLLVEGDGGVRGVAVGTDASGALAVVGAGHGGHAGQAGDLVERGGHGLLDVRGADGAGGGVPDDGVAVAGEAGEALLQQLHGAPGLGAGDVVVVGVGGARDGGGGCHSAEGEKPQQDRQKTVPDTPACEGCHERAPSVRGMDL